MSEISGLKKEIQNSFEVLSNGGIILYPTDTVWGIGCDAKSESAVQKVYDLKKREASKSLIVLIDEAYKLNLYVKQVPNVAWDLVEYAEKPLTIIYPGAINLAKNLINTDGTIAIRVIKEEFCKNLLRKFQKPIVSTSANISGESTPLTFKEISSSILRGVDYIVNLRQKEELSSPSTIIKLELNGRISFIRK